MATQPYVITGAQNRTDNVPGLLQVQWTNVAIGDDGQWFDALSQGYVLRSVQVVGVTGTGPTGAFQVNPDNADTASSGTQQTAVTTNGPGFYVPTNGSTGGRFFRPKFTAGTGSGPYAVTAIFQRA